MRRAFRIALYICFIFSSAQIAFAGETDSLLSLIHKSQSDTEAIRLYAKLTEACSVEDILKYSNEGLELILKKHSKETDPDYAFYETEKARFFNNIGFYYHNKLNPIKAIEYYQKAILILEKINSDEDLLASLYNNAAAVYVTLKYYHKSIASLSKVIAIDKKNKNEKILALDYNNLGTSYNYLQMRDSAIYFFRQSLQLRRKFNDEYGTIMTILNISSLYFKKEEFTAARQYLDEAFEKLNQLKNPKDSVVYINAYTWKGSWLWHIKDYKAAEEYFLKAYRLSISQSVFTYLNEITRNLYSVYYTTGDYKNALLYYQQFHELEDSTVNQRIENDAEISDIKFDYEKKQILMKAAQDKELAIEKEAKSKRTILLILLLIIISIVIAFLIIIYNRWKLESKQKLLIEEQKTQLSIQHDELDEAHRQLNKKNKQITDSIDYALNIQHALLQTEEEIKALTQTDCFVLFKPKDIVSGDFYILKKNGRYIFWALADCTGHGVPGAFISIISIKTIEKTLGSNIKESAITNILNQLHEEFLHTFSNEEGIGIDIVIGIYDVLEQNLHLCGSGNSVLVVSEGKMNEYKFDNLQLGKKGKTVDNIHISRVKLKKGDCIYAATDGFADQIGDESKKRYSASRLKQVILDNHAIPMADQKLNLERAFNGWKGDKEQYDDITVMGWRI